MAPKKKTGNAEAEIQALMQDFMRQFPKMLAADYGHLISIWICTYLGTQQECTWDGAARELLSHCLLDTGRCSVLELEEARRAKKAADSSTSAES